jgi:hypothetical protein
VTGKQVAVFACAATHLVSVSLSSSAEETEKRSSCITLVNVRTATGPDIITVLTPHRRNDAVPVPLAVSHVSGLPLVAHRLNRNRRVVNGEELHHCPF